MDIERPHRTTSTPTTSDLFICFTSRLSHSSMRLSSKSILTHNGSLRKGAQSPAMFPTTENPEPSSPKVTCIGQVRVKTKKQGKKIKMLAFRSKHRNQRWVHLPLTICETLKGLGSEFSCLLPCKSSCFSGTNSDVNGRDKSSCFRWMVSLQEGERRDIELVVNGDDDEFLEEKERERVMERECSRRRSIFDDMEFDDLFKNEINNVGIDNTNDNGNGDGREEEGGRVSICVPPKNALLLMRCRSDPMRMASLSKKFWDPPLVQQDGDYEVDEEVVVIKEENHVKVERLEVREDEIVEIKEERTNEINEESVKLEVVGLNIEDLAVSNEVLEEQLEEEGDEEQQKMEEGKQDIENNVKDEQILQVLEETLLMECLNLANGCSIETITSEKKVEEGEDAQDLVKRVVEKDMEVEVVGEGEESCVFSTNSSTSCTSFEESTEVSKELDPSLEKDIGQGETRKSIDKENNKPMLPDCLLLMMCEPKLSMEVSKETWVCGTDFARWLPERHHNKKANKTEGGEKKTKAAAVAALPPLPPSAQGGRSGIHPGRSSISFPASGGSVASLIEQKLAKAGVGYEPFVLTRCKSAPMRSTAKFVAPELGCSMWGRENGRKLEPHRPATCGVGAAGVGF